MAAAFEQINIPACLFTLVMVAGAALASDRRRQPLNRRRCQRSRMVPRGERGAAYTLSYVMVVPILAWLMCLIGESVVMMTAKLGTNYAAFAGARTAAVWSSATTWARVQEKSRDAAIQAFVPFASGVHAVSPLDAGKIGSVLARPKTAKFILANKEYSSESTSAKYLTKKYVHSHLNVKLTLDGPPGSWNAPIKATAEYRYPFQVPGIGRLLGKRGLDGRYYFTLRSTVVLPNEGPQNSSQTLGIGYGSLTTK